MSKQNEILIAVGGIYENQKKLDCTNASCDGIYSQRLQRGDQTRKAKKEEDKKEPVVSMVANDVYVEPVNPTNAQITAYNKLSAALENQDTQEEANR